jgi:hydrogenase-4 component H
MVERIMPEIDSAHCTLCGDCVKACPSGALALHPECGIVLDREACVYCGDCEDICPVGAIRLPYKISLATNDRRKQE